MCLKLQTVGTARTSLLTLLSKSPYVLQVDEKKKKRKVSLLRRIDITVYEGKENKKEIRCMIMRVFVHLTKLN